MDKKKRSYGFTIVELVIVISVIAILAAVLIPTFTGVIKKANISSDIMLIKNMNTSLEIDELLKTGKPITAFEAIDSIKDTYSSDKVIKSRTSGYVIAWDSKENQFVLIDNQNNAVFPEYDGESNKSNLWVILEAHNTDYEELGYNEYIMRGYNAGDITAKTGVDVGYNEGINISYVGTMEKAIVRTNSGKLTVDNDNAVVWHYGTSDIVNIIACKNSSFHLDAKVEKIAITKGRLVFEKEGEITGENKNITVCAANLEDVKICYRSTDRGYGIVSSDNTDIKKDVTISIIDKDDQIIGSGNCDHEWNDGEITTQPTCSAKGVKTYTCAKCSAKKTEDIANLGHDLEHHDAKAANCTEKGWDAYDTCKRDGCTYTTYHEIAAKGHTEVIDKAVAATCTATGLTEGKHCSVCDMIFVAQNVVPVLDHEWEWIVDTSATILATGLQHQKCKYCDAVQNENTVIEKLICTHSSTMSHVFIAAKCEEPGSKAYWYCNDCNKNFENEQCTVEIQNIDTWKVIAATGHTEVTDSAVAATCTATGLTEGKHCSVCNKVLVAQTTTSALPHNYGQPTYAWSDDNLKCTATRSCTRNGCSHEETETATGTYVKDANATFGTNEKGHYEAAFANSAFSQQRKDIEKQTEGKYKWVTLGTSLSIQTGNSTSAPNGTIVPFTEKLKELSGLDLTNYSASGAVMSGHILLNADVNKNNYKDADLITIEGSVNDFNTATKLGVVGDTIPSYVSFTGNNWYSGNAQIGTFAGACYSVFNTVVNNAPNAVVVLITDATGVKTSGADFTAGRQNSLALTQADYYNVMKQIAESLGIIVIDAGANSGVSGDSQYFADHIHLNDAGATKFAEYVWSQLSNVALKQKSSQTLPTYTVTFTDGNGKTLCTTTVRKGQNAVAICAPSMSEKEFTGWDKTFTNVQSDLTVNATWKDAKHTITFNTAGGSSIEPITGDVGASFTPPQNPTKDGFIFDGWDKAMPNTIPANDITLTARWRDEDELHISLNDTVGKSINVNNKTIVDNNGYTLTDFIATNKGYVVINFNSSANVTIYAFSNNAMENCTTGSWTKDSSSDARLEISSANGITTILWKGTDWSYIRIAITNSYASTLSVKAKTYTVTFKNGDTTLSTQTVKYGCAAIAPSTPVPETGYVFDGWDTAFTSVKQDLTVKVKWKVSFDSGLYDETKNTQGQYLNSTSYASNNAYFMTQIFECVRYDQFIIEFDTTGTPDVRIAPINSSNNPKAMWNVINSQNVTHDMNDYSVSINGSHYTVIYKLKSSDAIGFRMSFKTANVSNISVKKQ